MNDPKIWATFWYAVTVTVLSFFLGLVWLNYRWDQMYMKEGYNRIVENGNVRWVKPDSRPE